MDDVTSAMIQLSVMAVRNPTSVPDHVKICGDAKSWKELAEILGKEVGEKIECKAIPLDEYMQTAEAKGFVAYLRYAILLPSLRLPAYTDAPQL